MAHMANNTSLLSQAVELTQVVSLNVQDTIAEWEKLRKTANEFKPSSISCDNAEYVVVKRSALNHLATEVSLMKELLPDLIQTNKETTAKLARQLKSMEKSVFALRSENQAVTKERDQAVHRLDSVIREFEKEKKDHFELKCERSNIEEQLNHQSQYCTSLGLVCCTLLWRASQSEHTIPAMIGGTKTEDFLSLVSATTTSFIDSYGDTPPNDTAHETQFLLSLHGVVTNISASACGREYISNSPEGRVLVRTSFGLLSSAHQKSINQNGLLLLRDLPRIFHSLISLFQAEPCAKNRLYCLQLVQSLLLEPHTASLARQVNEEVPLVLIHQLITSTSTDPGLAQLAREIIADISTLNTNFLQKASINNI